MAKRLYKLEARPDFSAGMRNEVVCNIHLFSLTLATVSLSGGRSAARERDLSHLERKGSLNFQLDHGAKRCHLSVFRVIDCLFLIAGGPPLPAAAETDPNLSVI